VGGVAIAETPMSYLERAVFRIVADVYQRTREPVRTIAVQARLGKGDRNCRRYLAAMERRGLVLRVGERGGWLPVTKVEPAYLVAEYARLRRYAAELEWQRDVMLRVFGLHPARSYSTLTRLPVVEDDELIVQPPLPGFDDLVGDIYLN